MYPYFIFMIVYLFYMNWFYLIRNDPGYEAFNYVFIGVLGYFCYYFMSLEIKQLTKQSNG